LEAGEIFGEVEVLGGIQRETMVQALEPVLVCEIHRDDFERFLERCPPVGNRLLKLMGGRLRYVESKLSDLVFRSAPARLAQLLLELSQSMGEYDEKGIRLNIRLTHQNLANLIGTSRETVSTLLRQFQRQGLVTQDHRFIFLHDPSRLAQIK
jgi:CRP-like cAMP-binding protein